MPTPAVSVILSTYNRPDALEAVLLSLDEQDTDGFEVIVADDGSGPETASLLAAMKPKLSYPLQHIWHPDTGFRLATIRNRAVEAATGQLLVFLDGDCLVRRDFVRQHLKLGQTGWFVVGKRSYLRQSFTASILASRKPVWRWSRLRWLWHGILLDCTRPLEFLPRPDGRWRYRKANIWEKAQGCNLGIQTKDFWVIGGFDERFVGHGYEDSDFVVRLLHHGIRRKSGDHAAIVLHLWHPRPSARPEKANNGNYALFQATLQRVNSTSKPKGQSILPEEGQVAAA